MFSLFICGLVCSAGFFLFFLFRYALSGRGGRLFFFSTALFFILIFMVPATLVLLIVMLWNTEF